MKFVVVSRTKEAKVKKMNEFLGLIEDIIDRTTIYVNNHFDIRATNKRKISNLMEIVGLLINSDLKKLERAIQKGCEENEKKYRARLERPINNYIKDIIKIQKKDMKKIQL